MLRRTTAGLAALLTVAWGATLWAGNPSVNVQLFRPSAFPTDYLQVRGATLPPHLTVGGALALSYGNRPLVFTRGGGSHAVVEHQLTLDLLVSAAFFERFGVGLALPFFLYQRGEDNGFVPIATYEASAMGDLRVQPVVVLLPHRGRGFGLALDLSVSVPTAQDGRFAGDAGVQFAPRVAAEVAFPRVRGALNLGYLVRADRAAFGLRARDRLLFELAAAGTLWPDGLEAFGELLLATPAAAPFVAAHEDQMEGRLGLGYRFGGGFHTRLAVGGGFLDGWGTPEYRLVLQVGFAGAPSGAGGDAPPALLDPDGDSILGAADLCPLEPEDFDGFQDEDGCPDPDNDADGVPDVRDLCPLEPEDLDGFQDEDGCPDPDNDGDGIPDAVDRCPNEPETPNGFEDDDGCPDEFPVSREDGHLVLRDPIRFLRDAPHKLEPASFDTMARLAEFLNDHPEITRVRVEAHSDSEGDAAANLALTQAQAEAVVAYLVALDVRPARLVARGHGETRPIAPNTEEWGRAANRRVELVVED
jgi:outer membrane protein OmpA-like peptidoglycan-associated protein